MKIVFPSSGNSLDAKMEDVFGRAKGFLIYDTETKKIETIDNTANLKAEHGVGMKSAEIIADAGADVLVSKSCGPKAQDVLNSAGVKVIISEVMVIREALKKHDLV